MNVHDHTLHPAPRVTLVVPAFNEAALLPRLLDTVDLARQRYVAGPGAVEVIVADNASTDATPDIARARGCHVVYVEKRAIAAARNGGAQAARADIVAFVDADSQVHPDTFNVIERSMASGRVVVGATGLHFERLSFGVAITWALVVPMLRLANLDGGVVFCRRTDWQAVGGYNEDRFYAEDVQFLQDLKRLGRPRGQRFARPAGAKATISVRKFDQHGDWHFLATILLRGPFWLLFARSSLERWVQRYWYEDRA